MKRFRLSRVLVAAAVTPVCAFVLSLPAWLPRPGWWFPGGGHQILGDIFEWLR